MKFTKELYKRMANSHIHLDWELVSLPSGKFELSTDKHLGKGWVFQSAEDMAREIVDIINPRIKVKKTEFDEDVASKCGIPVCVVNAMMKGYAVPNIRGSYMFSSPTIQQMVVNQISEVAEYYRS